MSDEIRDDEAQQEDVEGHGLVNEPGAGAPEPAGRLTTRATTSRATGSSTRREPEPLASAGRLTTRATTSRLTASSTQPNINQPNIN